MFDEAALLQIFIDKMPTELECQTQGCNHGEGGAPLKTPPLTDDNALEMLKLYRADEPVRQFAARLRGLAAVCDLTITCTCLLKVDKCVRMFLVCGLNDEDTKQAVLSKVDEMTTLDDTIAFIGSQGVRERNQRRFGKMQTLWEERPSEKSVH